MSASLLAELSAIESMMTKRAAQKRSAAIAITPGANLPQQAAESQAEAASPPVAKMDMETEVEREHTCAICLVGLLLLAKLICCMITSSPRCHSLRTAGLPCMLCS